MLNENDSSYLVSRLSNDASNKFSMEIQILDEQAFMNKFQMLKPRVSIDGNMYCVSYGNMPEGIQGFGDTINKAIADFNKQFNESLSEIQKGTPK